MKFLLVTNKLLNFEMCHLNSKIEILTFSIIPEDFLDFLNSVDDNSVIVTNIFFNNEEIFWFNNNEYNQNLQINQIIESKKIQLFRFEKLEIDNLNIINYLEIFYTLYKNKIKFKSYKNEISEKLIKKTKSIKNCIIVGNGKNHSSPEFIDSKDFIVRVNDAYIKGYENIVGKKTDLYYKGASQGICDIEYILNNKNILKLTDNNLFNKKEREWLYSGYFKKYNFHTIFRKLKFFYLDSDLDLKNYLYKNYIYSTGQIILFYMLANSIINNLNYKIYISGFNNHKGINKIINSKDFKPTPGKTFDIPYESENYPYYFKMPEEDTKFANSNNTNHEAIKAHNWDGINKLQELLIVNKLIYV